MPPNGPRNSIFNLRLNSILIFKQLYSDGPMVQWFACLVFTAMIVAQILVGVVKLHNDKHYTKVPRVNSTCHPSEVGKWVPV